MEAVFLKLVNLSISAGWLVLAILVLRLVFRKAPRWTFDWSAPFPLRAP